MAFSRINRRIEDLNQDIRAYVQNKLEYFELKMMKKVTELSAKIVTRIAATLIFLMFLTFASIAIAIIIGRNLGDISLGFFIVAGLYFIVFLLILIFGRRMFSTAIVRKLSKAMTKKNKK